VGRADRDTLGWVALALLAFGLLAWFLWPFLGNGARFPLGPDGPVYLWWTRLAGLDGLSVVGARPGVPALALVLQGTLGLSVVQSLVALEVGLGVATGLAAAALVRRQAPIGGWVLAGVLAGTFAVHLASGYLANLAMVATFLAAGALIDLGGRRAAVVAAVVFGAGGLAHPPFFLVGAVILLGAAALAWRGERDSAVRIAGTVAGAGAVIGIGLLAVMPGPNGLDVDTSKDAFLRRAGLTAELRSAYLDRFVHRWTRYVQWVSVPLAIVGFAVARGLAGRILRSWLLVTGAGVAIALVTGGVPADRFVTFGFAVPILAALGLVRVWFRLERRRALAVVVTGALVVAMLAGAGIAWNRQQPFLSDDEVDAVTIANDAIVGEVARGTPLAFLVNEPDSTVSFLATRAGNVIRAGVPPDRIRDVVVVVPPAEGGGSTERVALEHLTRQDLENAEARAGRPATVFVLTPFDPVDRPPDARIIDPPVKDTFPIDPLEPSSAIGVVWASVAALLLLSVVGFGWATIGTSDRLGAAATAPAVGAAMLIAAAVALDALGVSIGTTAGALAASALAGLGGYLVRAILERRVRTGSMPQIQEQPAE
jgi:hypothetical protein